MHTNPVNTENKIWDFSQTEKIKNGPIYRVYGDSLISEIFRNRRQWYSLDNHTAYFIGEESRYDKLTPICRIPTSVFYNQIPESGSHNETSSGKYFKTFQLEQYGTYTTALPIKGEIILSSDLSISATAISEIRNSRKWIKLDSLTYKNLLEQETIRTRWFIDNDSLPIALQYSEKTFFNGKETQSVIHTYIVDFENEPIIPIVNQLQKNINDAVITIESNTVRIHGNFPESTILSIYISDITGKFVIQKPINITTSGHETSFTLPTLSTGQYILTISAGTPTNRKHLFTM